MSEAAVETASKFKEIHNQIFEKAKENLSKEELEKQKEKILQKTAEELAQKIEAGYKEKFESGVVAEILKLIQQRKSSSSNDTNAPESVPVALQQIFKEVQVLGGQHDWNWKNDYTKIINSLLSKYPEIKQEYEDNLKKIVEMSKNGNLTEAQIRLAAKEMSNNIKSKLPNKEEINKIISETENITHNVQAITEKFNVEEFREQVKLIINNIKGKFCFFLLRSQYFLFEKFTNFLQESQ